MDAQSRLVTIGEAARELRVSRGTIYNLINRGELKRANIGARAFIPAASLDAYLDRISR